MTKPQLPKEVEEQKWEKEFDKDYPPDDFDAWTLGIVLENN